MILWFNRGVAEAQRAAGKQDSNGISAKIIIILITCLPGACTKAYASAIALAYAVGDGAQAVCGLSSNVRFDKIIRNFYT
jgi:hypothetical protein